jgi:signal transduction histidine kinase
VAHDLSNLLLVIAGLSELALKRASAGEAPARELERIQRAAARARELARDLLAVAGRQALRPREIDLNQALTDAQERLRTIAGEQVELQLALSTGAPLARVDPLALERIFDLLAQAARHRLPEGGRWVLETGAGEAAGLRDGATGLARYARLLARDTGARLDASTRARIFEPYYSAAGGPGFGLALAALAGIVTQSGGCVRADDGGPDGGGSFLILLPASAAPGGREPEAR